MSGRPYKNSVDYFPHFATGGKTIFILQNRYGNDGYAVWFKLLELLSRTENHYFCVRNASDCEFLGAIMGINTELLERILRTLAECEAIDLELWNHRIIWCQKLVNNLVTVYQKRKREIPQKPDKKVISESKMPISVPEIPISVSEILQSKVKYSIVKESTSTLSVGLKKRKKKKPLFTPEKLWNTYHEINNSMNNPLVQHKIFSDDYLKKAKSRCTEFNRKPELFAIWCEAVRKACELGKKWATFEYLCRNSSKYIEMADGGKFDFLKDKPPEKTKTVKEILDAIK